MITEGFELADYACSSANSRGRAIEEKSSTSRTEFQRDRDRIIHSSLSADWNTRRRSL